ncbi:hypothetical protein BJ741DRAFT_666942 [Chytriomyces cf. hyalinus JEL632]|nr:hypothetical protein BJ741DRAFT_666942 [Chytriomyces cf. hyalinus JEL632]
MADIHCTPQRDVMHALDSPSTATVALIPSLVQESQPSQPNASPDAKESNPSTQRSAPVPLYLRKPEGPFMPSICHHNKRRSQCIQCYDEGTGGSTICHHRRQRYSCRACFDEGVTTNSLCQHRRIRKKCKLCTPEPSNPARKYAKRGAKKLAGSENQPFSDMPMEVQPRSPVLFQPQQPQFSACYAVPFGGSAFIGGEMIHAQSGPSVDGMGPVNPFSAPTQPNTLDDEMPRKREQVEPAPLAPTTTPTTTPTTVHQQVNSSPPSASNHIKPPLQTTTTQSATPLTSAKSSPKKRQRNLTMHDFVPVMYHPLQYPQTQIGEQQQQPAYMLVYPGGIHGQAAISTPVLMHMPPGFHSPYFPAGIQQSYWHSAPVMMAQGGRGSPPATPWMPAAGVPGSRGSVRGDVSGGVDGISLLIHAAEK